MMQLCRLFFIPILCWTTSCLGAAVLEPPNAANNNNNDNARILYSVAEAVGANGGQDTTTTTTPAEATGPLKQVKVSVLTGAGEEEKGKVEEKSSNFLENGKSQKDNVVDNLFKEREENTNSLNGEAVLSRRIKRSFAPVQEIYSPANRRYRRLIGATWKRRPWRDMAKHVSNLDDDDYFLPSPSQQQQQQTSSYPESGSLIYLVSPSDIHNKNNKNSFEESDRREIGARKDCSEETFASSADSPFQDAPSYSSASVQASDEQFVEKESEEGEILSPPEQHQQQPQGQEHQQPLKRVDRSLSSLSTSDMLASAGQNIARNFMKRRRGGRMYDVPQIGKFCQMSADYLYVFFFFFFFFFTALYIKRMRNERTFRPFLMLLAATTAAAGQQRERLAKFTLFVWKAVVVVYSYSPKEQRFSLVTFRSDVVAYQSNPCFR